MRDTFAHKAAEFMHNEQYEQSINSLTLRALAAADGLSTRSLIAAVFHRPTLVEHADVVEVSPAIVAIVKLYDHRRAKREAWSRGDVDIVIKDMEDGRDKRIVDWFARRSQFLTYHRPIPISLSQKMQHCINAMLAGQASPDDAMRSAFALAGYDHERATAVETILGHAQSIVNRDDVERLVSAALDSSTHVKISTHRLRIFGAAVRAAAAGAAPLLIARCFDLIAEVTRSQQPQIDDVLLGLRPAIAAIENAELDAARDFLASMEDVTLGTPIGRVHAVLSNGYRRLEDSARAHQLLEAALASLKNPPLSHVSRFEVGVEILRSLDACTADETLRCCENVVDILPLFTDSFVTAPRFAVHQVLIAEEMAKQVMVR